MRTGTVVAFAALLMAPLVGPVRADATQPSIENSKLPERRDSLPTRGRGFKGGRRSTPLLNDERRDSLPARERGVQGDTAQRPPAQEDARITLDVRDADITDIVRLLAGVGGFQVVLDPGVSCKLTLKLKEVLWPAVLEVALRSCSLAKEEDNGIVRIATAAKLSQEAAERTKLEEQQRLAAPQRITTVRLSYARARDLAPVLKKMLSPRGDVIWDERTNTLIVID